MNWHYSMLSHRILIPLTWIILVYILVKTSKHVRNIYKLHYSRRNHCQINMNGLIAFQYEHYILSQTENCSVWIIYA